MELPIFSDNLKSSASWAAALDREDEALQLALGESNRRIKSIFQDHQVNEALKRSKHRIDEAGLRIAASMVASWAGDREAKLSVGRLIELQHALVGALPGEDVLRKTEPLPINAMHDPTPAILLPRMLDNAFDWFSTPGFDELHPVEQAAVVYLRLLDLHPFPTHTETTSLLAASFYTERANFPPLIIYHDEATVAKHNNALEAAFRMLTQPLVEFFAEELMRTMQSRPGIEK